MIMDNKGKIFGKVSIVDIVIICGILLAIAFIGYKYVGIGKVDLTEKLDTVVLQFYTEEVNDYVAKAVNIGDTTSDFERNINFGTIKNISISESKSVIPNTNTGKFVEAPKPGCSSIKLTVEAKGKYSNTGVNIEKFDYSIGKTITLRAGRSIMGVRLYDITMRAQP